VNILGINGSPRKEGNTHVFLQTALNRAAELGASTKSIWLGDKLLRGCKGCYGCVEKKRCVVEDDFAQIFDEIRQADGILVGSPVYHASMTAELKALLDRAGFSGRWAANAMKASNENYQWSNCLLTGKVVAPITVARRTGQTLAFAEILMWAVCNDAIIVGNAYWNMGMAGKGGAMDAEKDTEGMGIMRGLAERMVHTIKKLSTHTDS